MSLKNCPFCGGEAETFEFEEGPALARTRLQIECSNASDNCPMAVCSASFETMAEAISAWNTRTAPTMKKWEWEAMEPHSSYHVRYSCNGFEIRNDKAYGWTAHYDLIWLANKNGAYDWHESKEEAQAACVAYVESKLKEWLV